jgi:alpha-glucosidase
MKAALNDDMYFKPLAFVYPEDTFCREVEDQLMIGNEIMIAPVYTQNAHGRYVYLPERMKFVKFGKDGVITEEVLEKGHHYVEIELNEVPLFIREGKCIPVAEVAQYVEAVSTDSLTLLGFDGASYELYEDDGVHKDYENPANYRTLVK